MSGHQVQIERDVAASPEEVWRVLTDLDHAAETLSGVSRVELLTEGPYTVGTRWRETRKMFGKEATEEMRVTAVEAPARTTVEADSAGVNYVTVFTLTPNRSAITFHAFPWPIHNNPCVSLYSRRLFKACARISSFSSSSTMAFENESVTMSYPPVDDVVCARCSLTSTLPTGGLFSSRLETKFLKVYSRRGRRRQGGGSAAPEGDQGGRRCAASGTAG